MRYNVIPAGNAPSSSLSSYGCAEMVSKGAYEVMSVKIFNKRNSNSMKSRNKKLFAEIVSVINKYYDLRDCGPPSNHVSKVHEIKRVVRGML